MTETHEPVTGQPRQGTRRLSIEVAAAGTFTAISVIISPIITPVVPRLPWGIALFDPISIVWMICFLLFGWRPGIITLVAGSLLLFPLDPTAGALGPIFKLIATAPLMIVPTIAYYMSKNAGKCDEKENDMRVWLVNIKRYVVLMAIALGVRIGIMLPINSAMYGFNDFVVNFTLVINITTTVFDAAIPYLISFKLVPRYMTGLYCV